MSMEYLCIYLCLQILLSVSYSFHGIVLSPPWLNSVILSFLKSSCNWGYFPIVLSFLITPYTLPIVSVVWIEAHFTRSRVTLILHMLSSFYMLFQVYVTTQLPFPPFLHSSHRTIIVRKSPYILITLKHAITSSWTTLNKSLL